MFLKLIECIWKPHSLFVRLLLAARLLLAVATGPCFKLLDYIKSLINKISKSKKSLFLWNSLGNNLQFAKHSIYYLQSFYLSLMSEITAVRINERLTAVDVLDLLFWWLWITTDKVILIILLVLLAPRFLGLHNW